MILEGILTTVDPSGEVNISPLGPRVSEDLSQLTLRPFQGGRTFRNLLASRQAVFHVVDDAELLARSAVGDVTPPMRPAKVVDGYILTDACRAFELRVVHIDTNDQRSSMEARVVRRETLRDFYGWNRAKHAVVEAAILATRVQLLPAAEIRSRLESLRVLVQKTGSAAEHRALQFLENYVVDAVRDGHTGPDSEALDRVRVRTGARVHFGLITPGASAGRRFGGAGLMVAEPGLDIEIERSSVFEVEGLLRDRVATFATRYTGSSQPPVAIRIQQGPPDHVGLGTGTQLGLAVAAGLAHLDNTRSPKQLAATELAPLVGRGRRSAVGVHGFDTGGLIVEGGKTSATSLAPLVGHYLLPPDWRVLLVIPKSERGVAGAVEEGAFATLEPTPDAVIDRLSRLLLLGIVPAALDEDFNGFSEAVYEFGYCAGECFAVHQHGPFASPLVAHIIEFLRAEGVFGVGQSSWGPTVYAFVENEAVGKNIARRLCDRFTLTEDEVVLTAPLRHGATIDRQSKSPSLHTLV